MELNRTCLELLKMLQEKDDYLSIRELAELSGKTERSVRYSLDLIESFSRKQGFEFFDREFGKGIQLNKNAQVQQFFDQFLSCNTPYQYKFSPAERELFLRAILLLGREGYQSISDLASRLTVSVGTITSTLVPVENWLSEHSLALVKKPRLGLRVIGEEAHLRQVCLELLAESISLVEYENYLCGKPLESKISGSILEELFDGLDITALQDLPKQAEGILNRVFSDESFGNLIFFLSILVQRHKGGAPGADIPTTLTDNLMTTVEYSAATLLTEQLSKDTGITCTPGDRWCLTSQLLASKSIERGHSTLGRDKTRSLRLTKVAQQMVSRIEELYQLDFGPARKELVARLVTHMTPTVYRIRYNKKIFNPIYEELATKHRRLLQYTKEASLPLQEYCGAEIDDHEISYLALYFLAAINQQDPQITHRPQVIVACGSGYGTAQVVASQLNNLFDVDVVAVLSGRNASALVEKREVDCDYIISTVDLPRLPSHYYIKVNPIFTRNDYERILQHMDAKRPRQTAVRHLETADHLTELARKHGASLNLEQLKYEFLSVLIRASGQSDFLEVKSQLPSLLELLPPHLIQVDISCRDWQDTVAMGMVPLEEHGYVTADYKDAVVQNILDYGPGMVMFPGTLISHAGPASGCNKIGLSFMKLRHPVRFQHSVHDPVRIVFSLSVIDTSQHMDALTQLFHMLADRDLREQLFDVRTKEDVLKIIRRSF